MMQDTGPLTLWSSRQANHVSLYLKCIKFDNFKNLVNKTFMCMVVPPVSSKGELFCDHIQEANMIDVEGICYFVTIFVVVGFSGL